MVNPIRSKIMKAIKSKENKSTELVFRSALQQSGISGWTTNEKITGTPDIFFSNYKVAIFLDGCFWHLCPKCGHIPQTNYEYWKSKLERNVTRDRDKAQALQMMGFLVIRFWEHEINQNVDSCIERLKEIIEDNLIRISKFEEGYISISY